MPSKNTTINSHFFGSINVIIGLYLRISFKIEKKTSIVSPTAVKEKKSFLKNSTYATRLRSSLSSLWNLFLIPSGATITFSKQESGKRLNSLPNAKLCSIYIVTIFFPNSQTFVKLPATAGGKHLERFAVI